MSRPDRSRRSLPLTLVLLSAVACTPTGTPRENQDDLAGTTISSPVSFNEVDPGQFQLEWRAEQDQLTTSPVSLTASDGTGLQLTTLDAKVVLEDPLALTEMTLSFHNPEDRVREGHFEINLPPGAAISRFSMLIDDEWQEAEVVERQAARVAYEDALHRKQDPALLENKAGNQFRARVFPIPAKGTKHIKIAYSQELRSSKEPYHLMLAGLPRIDKFDVDVGVVKDRSKPGMSSSLGGQASEVEHLSIHEQEFAPRSDLEVRFEREVVERGLRSGTLAVGRIAPVIDDAPAPITGLTVLFDTSASRALGFEGQVERLAKLLAALSVQADFPLEVVCFDQDLETVYKGNARGFAADARARILARHPLGASNLEAALTTLATREVQARVLVVTDGIVTAGDTGHDGLAKAVSALGARGVERLDALVDGGIQDEITLQALTTAGLEHDGVVANARLTEASLVAKLSRSTHSGIEVAIEGADWVWPRTLDGVQPGDEVVVYAQMPANVPMVVDLRDHGALRRVGVPTRAAQGPLLERAATRAQIDKMTADLRAMPEPAARDDDEQAWNKAIEAQQLARQAIIELSTRERVMSDYTALLVLETDADYQRFGIDRNALADILTVGSGGIELLNRSHPQPDFLAQAEEEPPEGDDDEFGGGSQRHKGEEGKMGKPSTKQKSGLYAMQGPRDAVPQMARDFDPDMAQRNAGILGVMAQESGHFLASPYGGAFAVGGDDSDEWGNLEGTEVGEAYGVGGLGLVGTGRGGGGTGEGTIGLGNTGLIGRGGGGGTGSGYGRGSGTGFGGRGRRVPLVRQAQPTVQGSLDRDIIRRIVRAHINEVRSCYNASLIGDPNRAGRVAINFVIAGNGKVGSSVVQSNDTGDTSLGNCIAKATKRWQFPKPAGGGNVIVTYPFALSPGGSTGSGSDGGFGSAPKPEPQDPYNGRFAEIMGQLDKGEPSLALSSAWQWRESEPGSELALLALGEAAEANARLDLANRAYGALIDLFPSRADIRRMAGERLERVALRQDANQTESARAALELALDTYAQAVEQRPDHPSSHRLYAYALVKANRHEDAFTAILAGITQNYPGGRFAGVPEILREDAGLIAAAWIAAQPKDDARVRSLLAEHNLSLATKASTRFILNWETDANDVDFHIYDSKGGHAFYSDKSLDSGGRLYADVTTGYGPECFAINGTPSAGPYTLQAHYFSMGPMGYGMGKLEVLRHDGHGNLSFEERPFVIMKDRAFVDLGKA